MNAGKTATNANRTRGGSASDDSVSEHWDRLAEQLDQLREDVTAINTSLQGLVKSGVSEGRDRVSEQIDDLAQRTREMSDEIGARGRRAARKASDQASTLTRDFEATINRNPLTAILIAVGLGFLIGLISRGRS